MSQSSRSVARIVTPEPVVEGAGVHLRRSIGTRALDHLNPFLLLDHFESARPADSRRASPITRTAGSKPSRSSGKERSGIGTHWIIAGPSAPVTPVDDVVQRHHARRDAADSS